MATRVAKMSRRMETIKKLYRITDNDLVSKLSFLEQSQRAWDSIKVLEGVAMLLFLFYIAKPPAALLVIGLTSRKDVHALALLRREMEGQRCIYTYAEAVNYLILTRLTT